MARKEAGKAHKPANTAAHRVQPEVANQGAEPVQFLDILGDVLPKGSWSKDPSASSQALSQFPAAKAVPNPAGQAGSEATAATAPMDGTTSDVRGQNQAVNNAVPNATEQALLEISRAVTGSDVGIDPQRNGTAQGEVAFAAQISARTVDVKAITLNETQAAIAAARFEEADGAMNQGSDETSLAARMAQVIVRGEEQTAVVASGGFEGPGSDGNSGGAQSHGEPNASAGAGSPAPKLAGAVQDGPVNQPPAPDAQAAAFSPASQAASAQPAAARVLSAQAISSTMVVRTPAAGREGPSPAAGNQNAFSGIAAAAVATNGAAGGRPATNARSEQPERATPFFEAQNELAERAGEVVRDISLNLTSKDQNVQVRLSERAGELRVTVRTPDSGLSHGLRESLSDLMGRLEHSGYRAEAWRPAGNDTSDRGQEPDSRRGSSQQQNGGGKGNGQRGSSKDPESDAQTPKWIGELESSLQRSNS